jgi:hypothetical protein
MGDSKCRALMAQELKATKPHHRAAHHKSSSSPNHKTSQHKKSEHRPTRRHSKHR